MFQYCEQTSFFVAQPMNVVSNLGFIGIGLWLWREQKPRVLVAIPLTIGLSSGLWHGTEQVWALILDVSCVLLGVTYIGVTLLNTVDTRWTANKKAFLSLFAALLCIATAYLFPIDNLRTSFFLPLAFFMLFPSSLPFAETVVEERGFRIAGLALLLACFFRAADLPLCSSFTFGTHWLWHLFTALSLFYVIERLRKRSN